MSHAPVGIQTHSSHALSEGRGLEAIERLTRLAATLLDCTTAVVLFNKSGVSRVVCGHGARTHYMSYRWSYDSAPYTPDQLYIAVDASAQEQLQHSALFLGAPVGFFLRAPVAVEDDHTVTLIVLDAKPKSAPDVHPNDLKLLDGIIGLIAEEMRALVPLLSNAEADVSVGATFTELVRRVEALDVPAALLKRDTTILAVSPRGEALLRHSRAELIGHKQREIAPRTAEIFGFFYENALAEGVSSPAIEISVDDAEFGVHRTFSFVATPLSPTDTREYFLLVTGEEITARVDREEAIEAAVQVATQGDRKDVQEPSAHLLLETLVKRRTIRTRHDMSYMTIRSWRQPLRKYQIAAITGLKAKPPPTFADAIAQEMAAGVAGLIGVAAFRSIVPVPCAHSAGECLSVAIARSLGRQLNLPMVQALQSERRTGRSHPRKNASRPPITLTHAVQGPVILVDDVATSGAHLHDAAELLKPTSAGVLPVAWIGGDATS